MYNTIGFENYAPTLGELADSGYPLFNDTWDTYVPEYKKTLEYKIIQYYYFNQIGAETPDRFRHFLNAELAKIMPYYNQLYASQLIKFDPMVNYAVNTQKRRIENLVRTANKDTSRMGNALRNFANSGMTTGNLGRNFTGTYDEVTDRDQITDYSKWGDEDTTGTLDQTVDTDRNLTRDTERDETIDRTLDRDETIDSTMESTINETQNNTRETTQHKVGNENVDQETDRTTTRTESNMYSDTPQENLNTQGDATSIRWDFLTNARYITTNEDMHETVNTDRDYTEDITTNEQENKNLNRTENATAHTTDNTDETENTTEHETIKTTEDETQKETTDQDTTDHKDWREQGNETVAEDISNLKHSAEDTSEATKGTSFENGTENKYEANSETGKEDEKQTTDTGNNESVSGFVNVTASDMLNAFRETFINVDSMIIDALRGLFMEVY